RKSDGSTPLPSAMEGRQLATRPASKAGGLQRSRGSTPLPSSIRFGRVACTPRLTWSLAILQRNELQFSLYNTRRDGNCRRSLLGRRVAPQGSRGSTPLLSAH